MNATINREGLVFFGISDLAGHCRGKGSPEADLPARLVKGVGMTGSNIMMSARTVANLTEGAIIAKYADVY